MKYKDQVSLFAHYVKRFPYFPARLESGFTENTEVAIVIPCFKEPHLENTLESIRQAQSPFDQIEVIVVVNEPEDATEDIVRQNKASIKVMESFEMGQGKRLQHLYLTDLPLKKAGVGLARKIGMDEAFRQFSQWDKAGYIVNLDADCTISIDYFTELHKALKELPRGGHFQFEHPYELEQDEVLKKGIVDYELHLRYHNLGLKSLGHPYLDHTVGSCMMVRSDVYGLEGGMNQRKAGEDFYFMNKIYGRGNCVTIPNARVYPSCRISDRVPFGTGRAQGKYVLEKTQDTYDPRIYKCIKTLIHNLFNEGNIPKEIQSYWIESGLASRLEARLKNSKDLKKVIYETLDAFQVLKLVHHLRDHYWPNIEVGEASRIVLEELNIEVNLGNHHMLEAFRKLESV